MSLAAGLGGDQTEREGRGVGHPGSLLCSGCCKTPRGGGAGAKQQGFVTAAHSTVPLFPCWVLAQGGVEGAPRGPMTPLLPYDPLASQKSTHIQSKTPHVISLPSPFPPSLPPLLSSFLLSSFLNS